MATALAAPAGEHPATPSRLGPFQVVGSLAAGGMGVVLRGRDLRDGRPVALKTARSPTKADAASLRREIAALERLSHPGIVRLIAHGHSDGLPWMAMELVAGRTIYEEIEALWSVQPDRPGRSPAGGRHPDELPTARTIGTRGASRPLGSVPTARPPAAAGRLRHVVGLVTQLGRALEHVHALGLVHRDVKPANVMLGGDGRVTLLDFGLVCAMPGAARAEPAEICVGTMEYAAPEQIRGEPVDGRADVYALGCLLYELLTGRRTIDTDSSGRMIERQPLRMPSAPSRLVASLPPSLESLLLAMLAKQRDDRPAGAGEVADVLGGIARELAAS